MAEAEEVLAFWFAGVTDAAPPPRERLELWFGGAAATDRLLRERYAPAVERVAQGKCDGWRRTARGSLALILLLDQFPRNIYRGTPQAYARDGQARAVCLEGLEQGLDRQLAVVERAFFYLPLEHAEDLEPQRRSVAAFRALLAAAPAPLRETCRGFLDFALSHCRIIERFGRFPHRNAVLGRPSTPEEEAFLRQPGSSF